MGGKLCWADVYSEAGLYKAAVRLYTKPIFNWRKALSTSTDDRTLYDFAQHGLKNLDEIHKKLARRRFHFRPGVARRFNFNGRRRTLYIYPWEERLVDLFLYRAINMRLHESFSPDSYAYRDKVYGLDSCQINIARMLRRCGRPVYILKRDITNYFASVDHDILLDKLSGIVDRDDYLFRILEERVRFPFKEDPKRAPVEGGDRVFTATRGIPFGAAISCLFANIYLDDMDRAMRGLGGVRYFRYADDLLALSPDRGAAQAAVQTIGDELGKLRLTDKESHRKNMLFAPAGNFDTAGACGCAGRIGDAGKSFFDFEPAAKFRHLGLEFRADGITGLSRDKFRKIMNLFRYSFRRRKGTFNRIKDPEKRARLAVELAKKTLDNGVRNVAIIDYYLKHVDDEEQLRRIDRWLAEEVLALSFGGGHRKGNFRRLRFDRLRAMGLPSLVHRRRLIRHGHIESPFFIWKKRKRLGRSGGTAARAARGGTLSAPQSFSPLPEAAASKNS